MDNQEADITFDDVDEVLDLVARLYGYDFRAYSRASMFRRLQKFMSDIKVNKVFDLKHRLVNEPAVFEYLLQRVTVNVTEMFRDPTFYAVIKKDILPVLASYPIIKIWHAGCSSGEEVYSMCILLHEAGLLKRTRIYATDINPSNIEKAKSGIMPLEVMKEYTRNYIQSGGESDFSSYYTARYKNAIIRKDLREQIVFSQHNLVTDGVFNEFQLICCRNVMIYFNRELQNRVINLFNDSLSMFGFLALGIKESLLFTNVRDNFEVINKQQKIFKKIV
jgi:chemotaxis protein methyltransferase CheR